MLKKEDRAVLRKLSRGWESSGNFFDVSVHAFVQNETVNAGANPAGLHGAEVPLLAPPG